MDSDSYDILEQYMTISSKLKKRFLRKPNITEACESFISLAKKCETLELPAYSSLCWIAAARCEGSLLNNTGETSCLVQSARQLFKAEQSDRDLGCKNLSGEYLQAGLSCFAHAESRYSESCSIPISLNLEIVEFLKRIGRSEYTQLYLENSIELSKARCDTRIHCLQLLTSHFINCGDYLAALEIFLEISKLANNSTPNGNRADILLRCEINSVFLLLILRPSPQKLSPCLAKILEKYTWGDQNDSSMKACRITEKTFLLLQSLVTTCQSLDTSSLLYLESDFWDILLKEEKELLRILVKTYQRFLADVIEKAAWLMDGMFLLLQLLQSQGNNYQPSDTSFPILDFSERKSSIESTDTVAGTDFEEIVGSPDLPIKSGFEKKSK